MKTKVNSWEELIWNNDDDALYEDLYYNVDIKDMHQLKQEMNKIYDKRSKIFKARLLRELKK